MENIIRNIDDTYSVSNLGKFYKNGVEMKGCIDKGYVWVSMYHKKYSLHRLIAEMFIPNPDNKPCVDHISTIKTDCRAANLRWVSHRENCRNPLTRMHNSEAKKGKNHPLYGKHLSEETRKKISNAIQKKPVLQFSRDGEFIREWESGIQIQKELGYNQGNISLCCLNKVRTAYDYVWKYKENC